MQVETKRVQHLSFNCQYVRAIEQFSFLLAVDDLDDVVVGGR